MGRPLWHATFDSTASLPNVLFLGGLKLLCGPDPTKEDSYNAKSLHGVAALMCRLGLRPQSSSAFASQLVADFMTVLHAVNYRHDAHISGYISDPFLTFAATHMWYEHYPASLTHHMLPQFREVLMQGVIDVGGIGEVMARIFLLLAIDSAIAKNVSGNAAGVEGFGLQPGKHHFQGQFCSVLQFLAELDGTTNANRDKAELRRVTIELKEIAKKRKRTDDSSLENDFSQKDVSGTEQVDVSKKIIKEVKYNEPTTTQEAEFEAWMNKWEGWEVGFSHFVELTHVPTKAALWSMLARRAAGVLPRGHTGADLIIPIVHRFPTTQSSTTQSPTTPISPIHSFR